MSKTALQRRRLSNPRIELYDCGRRDVRTGREPGQWHDLVDRLDTLENPVVPLRPSAAAVPVPKPGARTDGG